MERIGAKSRYFETVFHMPYIGADCGVVLFYQVPLINNKNACYAALMGKTGNLCILIGHPLPGIDHYQRDVASVQSLHDFHHACTVPA